MDDLTRAIGLFNAGAFDQAMAVVKAMMVATPEDHRALFLSGEVLLHCRDYAATERVFDRVLRLLPAISQDEVLYRIGIARLGLDRADAQDLLVEVVGAAGPEQAPLSLRAGILAVEKGRLALAETLIRHAALNPEHRARAQPFLIDCLKRLGRDSEADDILTAMLADEPDRIELAERLVENRTFQGDAAGAEAIARAMLVNSPGAVRSLVLSGWVRRISRRFDQAAIFQRWAVLVQPDAPEIAAQLGSALLQAGRGAEAIPWLERALELAPDSLDATLALAAVHLDAGEVETAGNLIDACEDRIAYPRGARRSVVIPVLDYSPGSPYNIRTLLDDLRDFDGEVICIFNGDEVFEDLRGHPRIDKWSYNKFNVGVARGWNMGINQAEGETIHILNADLKVSTAMLSRLEYWVQTLPDALCVGVSGHWMDFDTLEEKQVAHSGHFAQPVLTDQVSGQLFTLHARRLHDAGITFDPRLSPYFGEESDLAFKARQNGLRIYAVPETDFTHTWGISKRDRPLLYFGRPVHRIRCMTRNQILLRRKWARIKRSLPAD